MLIRFLCFGNRFSSTAFISILRNPIVDFGHRCIYKDLVNVDRTDSLGVLHSYTIEVVLTGNLLQIEHGICVVEVSP
jgi:hypothetical protein